MLKFEKITLLSSDLGECNNIPDITGPKNPLWFTPDETVSEKERELIISAYHMGKSGSMLIVQEVQ